MPQQSRIEYLLDRYVNRSCTREELDELFVYIKDEQNEEILNHLLANYAESATTAPDIDYENIYSQLIQPRSRIITLRRLAAAAAILLLAGSAFWYLGHTRKPQPLQVATITKEITPGSNKATLTLADGTVVTLDSAGNQTIRQGNQSITQQNGQLLYTGQGNTSTVHYNKLSTPRGGQFQIVLPDGTKVWLNSATTLRYPTAFTGATRVVELEGQGYFEVAPNATHPFLVKVPSTHRDSMEVQVLGTGFDVMAYADEATVNTTLISGSVRVKEGNTLQTLQPGQQAVMDNINRAITVRPADIKKVTAWKNGVFVFNNTALPAILREVARWYDVEIVYAATPSPELYGGGISRNLQLSSVLRLLEASGYNHLKLEGRRVIVLP
ncbi:FecR domain-containing protein [Chitinophaga sp.]|uniref:FecR family protein n=1 Tax=Chitinophaga sp. TaxID=1869181 RepID=UPI0031D1A804